MASIKKVVSSDKSVSYQITVSSGHAADGKQIRKYMTFTPSIHSGMSKTEIDKQVSAAAAEFENSVKANSTNNCDTTFEVFATYVMTVKSGGYKTRSREKNEQLLVRINAAIGKKKLRMITAQDLNMFYNSLRQMGVNSRTGGALSEKTILEHHRLISLILKRAVSECVLTNNVASCAIAPKPRKQRVNYYQKDKLKNILSCTKKIKLRNRLMVLLLATTGCRRGELLGLKFRDIDVGTGQIHFYKAVLYTRQAGIYIDTLKTDEQRYNTVPSEVVACMQEYRNWYIQYKSSFADWQGATDLDDCFLFIKDDGRVIHPDTVDSILTRFANKFELGKLNAHAFRHTYGSMLIADGVDVLTVSKLLGHANIETTLKYYAHLMSNQGDISKEHMTKLLGEIT